MSEKEQQEHEVTPGEFLRRHRRALWGGGALAALLLLVAGGILWKALPPSPRGAPPPAAQEAGIGTIDLQKAIRSHGDYETLQKLTEERGLLQEEMQDLLPVMEKQTPTVDAKPFDDSVWQKNAQNIIGQRAEIERQRKKAAAAYREATQADYEAQRDELNGRYLNAILNLQLKIQNADTLHLTDEATAELQSQLDALKQERGQNQYALYREREREIAEHADAAVAESLGSLHSQMEKMKAELEADAVRRRSEAQSRDAAAMEEKMTESRERQQNLAKKQEELAAKEQELSGVESRILNDIAGRAAKLAILHHFTMILANPATAPAALIPWEHRQGPRPERFRPVLEIRTQDVTDELIAELASMR